MENKTYNRKLAAVQQKVSILEMKYNSSTGNISLLKSVENRVISKGQFLLPQLPATDTERIKLTKKWNMTSLNKQLDESLKVASKEKMYILLWYPPWGVRKIDLFFIVNASECGLCLVTYDTSLIRNPATKAVVFHFFEYRSAILPPNRRSDQYYVYWLMESSTFAIDYNAKMKDSNSVFNLTMSHRPDADIVSPYGFPILTVQRAQYESNHTIDDLISKKRKLALWVVSNCHKSRGARMRMKLVKAMIAAGLKVDMFGKCFPSKVHWKYDDYKFYLAFENSYHCRGYITEKVFKNSLIPGTVPVVFGALKADYLVAAPPNSFIYAEDYTVSELVDYLNYLDGNDTAYRKYLEWREMDVTKQRDYRRAWSYCQLCRVLHGINYDNIFNENFHTDFEQFPLFDSRPKREVKSLSKWFYDKEDKNCLIATKRLKNKVS